MNARTVVAIGCSLNPDYLFPLPMSALLWRELVGYAPLLLLTGSDAEWREHATGKLALEWLDRAQISRLWLGHCDKISDATLSQVSRLLATADPQIFPETWVMLSDSDLWPLQKAFYHQHGTAHRCVLYYANGDHFISKENVLRRAAEGRRVQTIPMCHTVMRAKDWRAVFGLPEFNEENPGETIRKRANALIPAWMAKRAKDEDLITALWMSDQQIMTEALCKQEWFPGAVKMIPRQGHPPIDRLDRSNMNWDFTIAHVDTHLPRRPWGEHWPKIRICIEMNLPSQLEAFDAYRQAFVETL